MNRILHLLIQIVCFTACSQSEIFLETENKVSFHSDVDDYTRAVSTFGPITLSTLQASTDGFAVSTSGLGSTQMNNSVVKYNGSKWNYTGDYFWPLSSSQNVSFTAYAPAGTSGVTMTSSGITVAGFTPAITIATQIDLLYAPPTNFTKAVSGSTGVALKFNHLLSQIVFSVNTISVLGIASVNSIELNVPNPTGTYNGTTWSNSGSTVTYTIPVPGSILQLPMQTAPVLMVPKATLPTGTTAKINYSIINLLGISVNLSTTKSLTSLTNVTSWKAGYKITYNISLAGDVSSKSNVTGIEATEVYKFD